MFINLRDDGVLGLVWDMVFLLKVGLFKSYICFRENWESVVFFIWLFLVFVGLNCVVVTEIVVVCSFCFKKESFEVRFRVEFELDFGDKYFNVFFNFLI